MTPQGNVIAAWSNSNSVDAQRYNAAGVAQGVKIHVGLGGGAAVASNEAGDFVIAYQRPYDTPTGPSMAVYARLYNASGIGRSGEIIIDSPAEDVGQGVLRKAFGPSVVMAASGEFVAAWETIRAIAR